MRIIYLILTILTILILSSNTAKTQISIIYPADTDTIFAGDFIEFQLYNPQNLDYDLYYFDETSNDWKWINANYYESTAEWTVPQLTTPKVRFKVESNYIKAPEIIWTPGQTNDDEIKSVDFSNDDRLILTSAKDGRSQIWDIQTKTKIDEISLGLAINISDAVFHHNIDTVILAGNDEIYIWDRILGTAEVLTAANDLIRSLDLHPTRNLLAAASYDGFLRIIELPSGNLLRSYDISATGPIRCVRFSNDGLKVVFDDDESNIYIVNWETEPIATVFNKHTDQTVLKPIWYAEFSPDDQAISTGGVDSRAVIWDINSGTEILQNSSHPAQIRSALFNHVRPDFFTASIDGTIMQIDLNTQTLIHPNVTDPNQIISAKISNDGNYFVTGGRGNTFSYWLNYEYIDLSDEVTTNYRYRIIVELPNAVTAPGDYLPEPVILKNPIGTVDHITSAIEIEYQIEIPRDIYGLYDYTGDLTRGVWYDTLSYKTKTFLADNDTLTTTIGHILSSHKSIDTVKILKVSYDDELFSFYLDHGEIKILYDCTNHDPNGIIFDKLTSIEIRPNPATISAVIKLNLITDSKYILNLFNNSGELVSEIVNTKFKHGIHDIFIDLRELNSGIYTLQLISDTDIYHRRFVISR